MISTKAELDQFVEQARWFLMTEAIKNYPLWGIVDFEVSARANPNPQLCEFNVQARFHQPQGIDVLSNGSPVDIFSAMTINYTKFQQREWTEAAIIDTLVAQIEPTLRYAVDNRIDIGDGTWKR